MAVTVRRTRRSSTAGRGLRGWAARALSGLVRPRRSLRRNLADGELQSLPGVGPLVEPGEMAAQAVSGVEPPGDVGIDPARDLADALAAPMDGHGLAVMRIVGLAHQLQPVTHAHPGLKLRPGVELVTGDELAQQFAGVDARAQLREHRRQLALARGVEPPRLALSGTLIDPPGAAANSARAGVRPSALSSARMARANAISGPQARDLRARSAPATACRRPPNPRETRDRPGARDRCRRRRAG